MISQHFLGSRLRILNSISVKQRHLFCEMKEKTSFTKGRRKTLRFFVHSIHLTTQPAESVGPGLPKPSPPHSVSQSISGHKHRHSGQPLMLVTVS